MPTNLVFNPSIEGDTVGYLETNPNSLLPGGTIARVTSEQWDRTASLYVTASGNLQGVAHLLNGTFSVGLPYTLSVYLKGAVGSESIRVLFGDNNDGDWLDSTFPITNAWVRYSFTWTPASAVVTPCFTFCSTGTTIAWFEDAHMVEAGASASAYGDGAKAGWVWNGTPDASTSTGSDPAVVAFQVQLEGVGNRRMSPGLIGPGKDTFGDFS